MVITDKKCICAGQLGGRSLTAAIFAVDMWNQGSGEFEARGSKRTEVDDDGFGPAKVAGGHVMEPSG